MNDRNCRIRPRRNDSRQNYPVPAPQERDFWRWGKKTAGQNEGGLIEIWSHDDRGDVLSIDILNNTLTAKTDEGAGVFHVNHQAKQIIVASEDQALTCSLTEILKRPSECMV